MLKKINKNITYFSWVIALKRCIHQSSQSPLVWSENYSMQLYIQVYRGTLMEPRQMLPHAYNSMSGTRMAL